MTARFAGQCFLGGLLAGLAIMAGFAARTAHAIIKGHRMGDVVRFFDKGAKYVH